MKRLLAVALVVLVLIPVLVLPGEAWAGGAAWHGGGHGGWHGGWHGGCCWAAGAFALGLGVGVLATAPLWYPAYGYPAYSYPVYSYPAYAAPAYQAPPPAGWYYCQNPQGYYPSVPECPGGWMTVTPPGTTP